MKHRYKINVWEKGGKKRTIAGSKANPHPPLQEGGLDFIHTELTFVVVVVAMIFIASSFSLYSIFHPRCAEANFMSQMLSVKF